MWTTAVTGPMVTPRAGQRGQPDELAVVVLLRLLGTLVGGHVEQQDGAAYGLDRGPVGEFVEADEQATAVVAGRRHGEGAPAGLGPQHLAGGEPAVRLVGAGLDGHLTADAVRPSDHADDDFDAGGIGSAR